MAKVKKQKNLICKDSEGFLKSEGYFDFIDIQSVFKGTQDYLSEKEMCDFIELNAVRFCSDVLGVEYASHTREFQMTSLRKFGEGQKPRIDFVFRDNKGQQFGVECKFSKQIFHETTRAISQVLAYDVLAEQNNIPFKKMILVLSNIDPIAIEIIRKYKLPVEVILLSKKFFAKLVYFK